MIEAGKDVSIRDKIKRDRCTNHDDLSNGKILATQHGRGHVGNVYNETGRRRDRERERKSITRGNCVSPQQSRRKNNGDGAYAIIYYFIYRAESITGATLHQHFFVV